MITIEDQIDHFLTQLSCSISETIVNLVSLENLLTLVLPLLVILYRIIKQLGIWDQVLGRDKALEGLKRLRSPSGYPVNWIYYDNQEDRPVFKALFSRMKQNTKEKKIKDVLDQNYYPYLIATGGKPVEIKGVPPFWSQEARYYYPDNYPILIVFKTAENQNDKADKVCTLEDLDDWLNKEKDSIDFKIGAIVFGLLSFFVTFIRIIVGF